MSNWTVATSLVKKVLLASALLVAALAWGMAVGSASLLLPLFMHVYAPFHGSLQQGHDILSATVHPLLVGRQPPLFSRKVKMLQADR